MLIQHAENPLQVNSLIEAGQGNMIKVQNFQALIDTEYECNLAESHRMIPSSTQLVAMAAMLQSDFLKSDVKGNSDGASAEDTQTPAHKMMVISSNHHENSSSGGTASRLHVQSSDTIPIFKIEKVLSRGSQQQDSHSGVSSAQNEPSR